LLLATTHARQGLELRAVLAPELALSLFSRGLLCISEDGGRYRQLLPLDGERVHLCEGLGPSEKASAPLPPAERALDHSTRSAPPAEKEEQAGNALERAPCPLSLSGSPSILAKVSLDGTGRILPSDPPQGLCTLPSVEWSELQELVALARDKPPSEQSPR